MKDHVSSKHHFTNTYNDMRQNQNIRNIVVFLVKPKTGKNAKNHQIIVKREDYVFWINMSVVSKQFRIKQIRLLIKDLIHFHQILKTF